MIILSGTGLTGTRDGKVIHFIAGDTVWCPPGSDHWHGATPDVSMTHFVVTGSLNGNNVVWNETYTLSNDILIPKLGLGTWFINDEDAAQAVKDAIYIGYRHIDTAQAYGNESGVGKGIRTCGINRNDIFVTTKLDAGVKPYIEAVASIEGSLKKLELDCIDLMIIHSPQP